MDSGSSSSEPFDVSRANVSGSTRRRRRGIVEKKRRDRINNSLAELRRLIPSAIGKQGFQDSTKFEKSEILQMTVDYLKSQRSKVGGNYEQRNDLEPFTAGFQECMDETDRCLQSLLCIQDTQSIPMKNRLMSHLRSCISRWDSYNIPRLPSQLGNPSNAGWAYHATASHLPGSQNYLPAPFSHAPSFNLFPKSGTEPYFTNPCLGTPVISPCDTTAHMTMTAHVPCTTNRSPYSGLPLAP